MGNDLEARVMRLEAIKEIEQLKSRYCEYCDADFDPIGIGSLFVEDGIWDCPPFGSVVGRPAIENFFRRNDAKIVWAAHLVVNPIVELVDETHATGRWRMLMPGTVLKDGRREAKWLVGAYDDRFVRHRGRWLFEKLQVRVNFFEPYDGSWADTAVR